jgi:hypothetical protein
MYPNTNIALLDAAVEPWRSGRYVPWARPSGLRPHRALAAGAAKRVGSPACEVTNPNSSEQRALQRGAISILLLHRKAA